LAYLLAFLGIALLIVLHELGHLVAAKAVGMRVERFSLFFGPMPVKFKVGETEYGIGVIPLGGYAKISGMSPEEALPPEVVPRAYCNQPPWKRIVVVAAGPAVNLLVAFVIAWFLLLGSGQGVVDQHGHPVSVVRTVQRSSPAGGVLQPGDVILSVGGVSATSTAFTKSIASDRCRGPLVSGCRGVRPVAIDVLRHGKLVRLTVRPAYDTGAKRMLVGFSYGQKTSPIGALKAVSLSGSYIWDVTSGTVSTVARIFEPKERRKLHSIVGIVAFTQQSVAQGPAMGFQLLALISLALAIINLFPFLPLDGGHIFWAVVEWVRGRRVPLVVMQRASWVGVALILLLFTVGLSNDISALAHNGLKLPG
jgi:regulator of sigma E protease